MLSYIACQSAFEVPNSGAIVGNAPNEIPNIIASKSVPFTNVDVLTDVSHHADSKFTPSSLSFSPSWS